MTGAGSRSASASDAACQANAPNSVRSVSSPRLARLHNGSAASITSAWSSSNELTQPLKPSACSTKNRKQPELDASASPASAYNTTIFLNAGSYRIATNCRSGLTVCRAVPGVHRQLGETAHDQPDGHGRQQYHPHTQGTDLLLQAGAKTALQQAGHKSDQRPAGHGHPGSGQHDPGAFVVVARQFQAPTAVGSNHQGIAHMQDHTSHGDGGQAGSGRGQKNPPRPPNMIRGTPSTIQGRRNPKGVANRSLGPTR